MLVDNVGAMRAGDVVDDVCIRRESRGNLTACCIINFFEHLGVTHAVLVQMKSLFGHIPSGECFMRRVASELPSPTHQNDTLVLDCEHQIGVLVLTICKSRRFPSRFRRPS